MNVINDPWLPVRRASGVAEVIRPADIVSQFDADPIVSFNWGRPDYDAASREFIIGLLATACPPTDGKSWRAWWKTPPAVADLEAAFAPFAPAFNLEGDGALFMQDLDPLSDQPEKPVLLMPIESCGAITIVNNADLFQKRGDLPIVSCRAAAIILWTLQLYTGFGGVGHRVALRGRGPVTTLVSAKGEKSLWRMLWLNTPNQMDDRVGVDVFPWMSSSRLSQKPAEAVTTPQHVSPLTQFWGAPTRIRLVFAKNEEGLRCPITCEVDDVIVTGFKVANYGARYTNWSHVLSPHYLDSTGKSGWLPVHGGEDTTAYTNWPSFAGAPTAAHRPAEIVGVAEKRLLSIGMAGEASISLFAIDMDNTKARGVCEASEPLFVLPDEYRATFHHAVARLVDGAGLVASWTRSAIRDATVGEGGDINKGELACLRRRFYSDTEENFYSTLRSLSAALATHSGDPTTIVHEHAAQWLEVLRREALWLFDETAPIIDLRPSAAERAAKARLLLAMSVKGIGAGGVKVLGSLGLPLPEKVEKKSRKAA